ncbi:hypothetical protein D9M68_100440 [compost metagenome]
MHYMNETPPQPATGERLNSCQFATLRSNEANVSSGSARATEQPGDEPCNGKCAKRRSHRSPANSRFSSWQSSYFRFQDREAATKLDVKSLIFRETQSREFWFLTDL